MIRNPVKIGTIEAVAGATKDLSVPVGHNGTICGLYFMPKDGDNDVALVETVNNAVESILLEATSNKLGTFPILDRVTPAFLYMRELYYSATRGVVNSGAIISYDPSASYGKDEEHRILQNLGTQDLSAMNVRVVFKGVVANLTHVDVWADIDYNIIQPLGVHTRIAKMSVSVPANGGQIEVDTLPKFDPTYAYTVMHISEPENLAVKSLTLLTNGTVYNHRDTPNVLLDRLATENDRSPQPGFCHLDFAKEDIARYFLPAGMSEMKLMPTFAGVGGAGTSTVWYEVLKA